MRAKLWHGASPVQPPKTEHGRDARTTKDWMIHYISTNGVGNAWVGNELNVVARHGVPFVLHALRRPKITFFTSPWAKELDERTREVYPIPLLRLLASAVAAPFLFGGRFFGALGNALFGRRESFKNRLKALGHFFVACDWARRLRRSGERVSLIHSQWIHSGGTAGMYGAWLLGAPFSFTGHAADLFRDRVALLDKIRRAKFIVCISEFHREFFLKHGARPEQLQIVYCGIDLTQFAPQEEGGACPTPTLRVRSSGRLVGKKGFTYLIDACKLLKDRGVAFECVIAGSGPLQASLQAQIDRLGLGGDVKLTGKEIKQEEIPRFMRTGDLYALPCVWSDDGDVDGLPQMLMEALACGLPIISTRLVGIPDLIIDGQTGLLATPNNAQELADAIIRLNNDPALRQRLAERGRQFLYERFDLGKCLEPLVARFREALGEPRPVADDHLAAPLAGRVAT